MEFLPGGRVITNTGKKDIALFNCYVLPVSDSIDDIYDSVKKAAGIHKQGGGTGYNFSQLRPRGSYVKKSQGVASGPVSFIDQFDLQTAIINSGNRRDHSHSYCYNQDFQKQVVIFNYQLSIFNYLLS